MISNVRNIESTAVASALAHYANALEASPEFITQHHTPQRAINLALTLQAGFTVSPFATETAISTKETQLICRSIDFLSSHNNLSIESQNSLLALRFLLRDNQYITPA